MEFQAPPHLPIESPLKSKQGNPPYKFHSLIKYLAMAIFVVLPYVGFFLGVEYQKIISEHTHEMEEISQNKVSKEDQNIKINNNSGNNLYNWKSYENTTYGFSFAYPPEFVITLDSVGGPESQNSERVLALKTTTVPFRAYPEQSYWIIVEKLTRSKEQCLDETDKNTKVERINDIKFLKMPIEDSATGWTWKGISYKTIVNDSCLQLSLISKNFRNDEQIDKSVLINNTKYTQSIFENIISSFKLTLVGQHASNKPTITSDTYDKKNWFLYTNSEFNYTIRYPAIFRRIYCLEEQLLLTPESPPFGSNKYEKCGRDSAYFFEIMYDESYSRADGLKNEYNISASKLLIDGYSATKYRFEIKPEIILKQKECYENATKNNSIGGDCGMDIPKEPWIEVVIPHNEGNLVLRYPSGSSEYYELLNQMLSTIKFTDKKSVNINLYYYNQSQDKQISCLSEFITPVSRKLPQSPAIVEDSIKYLIQGELAESLPVQNLITEFPHSDFRLISSKIDNNGKLTLKFSEVPGFTTGGSCRVNILKTQIVKTAMQFSQVKQVIFDPEVFQP